MRLILMLVCAAVAALSQVLAQDAVVCFSGEGCTGDDLGALSPTECCVEAAAGRSFRRPGQEICSTCVVFGFFQDSFTDLEQESSYSVQTGYLKGAVNAGENLEFLVTATDGTAREGANFDYTLNTTQVTALSAAPDPPDDVVFTFNIDAVLLEPNETFSLQLAPSATTNLPTGEGVFFLDTLNLTIIDNDPFALAVSFENNMVAVDEGDGSLELCLVTNLGHAEQFDVAIQPQMKENDRPASGSGDFGTNEQTVMFEPSDNSSRQCINIQIIEDEVYEGDEQFLVNLGAISNDEVIPGDIQQVCVTISDNDVPQVGLVSANVSVVENDPNAEVCLDLEGLVSEGVEISVTLELGSKPGSANQATADLDYNSTAIMIVFGASEDRLQTMCVPLPIIDDLIANEADEEFLVTLKDVFPVGNIGNSDTCVTVIDDDIPVFSISPSDAVVSEDDGFVEICVDLEIFTLGRSVVVTATTEAKLGASNVATADSDYVNATFQLSFEALGGSQQICTNVSIIDDEITNEPEEQFSVSLVSASPVGSFGVNQACITITDDDIPDISLTPLEIIVFEGDDNPTVCLTLTGMLARTVIATAETESAAGEPNQATAGVDYEATTITVTFEPSDQPTQTLCGSVNVIDDTTSGEPDEQFSVRLTSAVPVGNLGTEETVITIVDDDSDIICPDNAITVENEVGMIVCQCLPGYTGDPFTACVDIDECMNMTDDCSENAECINTEGSFECVCKLGFTGDGRDCEDIDECMSMTDDCSENAECINTVGSFECVCKLGFTGDGRNCEDIDECMSMTDDCDENAECINTVGSFECVCEPGYTGDGRTCEDIDECMTIDDVCNEYVTCSNLEGSYTCECTNDNGTSCITRDVPITSGSPSTPTRPRSRFRTGMSGSGLHTRTRTRSRTKTRSRSRTSRSASLFSTKCTPKMRSKNKCGCGEGYTLDPNGLGCIDINECETGNDCNLHVRCINLPGSFQCVCKDCVAMDPMNNTRPSRPRTRQSKSSKSRKSRKSKTTGSGKKSRSSKSHS